MPLSIRLDPELEREISRVTRITHVRKSEIIRRCLKRFLSEMSQSETFSPYRIYQRLENRVPGSGHGRLSLHHRQEVLKRIRQKPRS